jgi:hypothetical protein
MAAVTIDDVIAFAPTDIANLSYGGAKSLYTAMQQWIAGMFGPGGTPIFPPAGNSGAYPNQRVVTDWFPTHELALDAIEGHGVGQSGVIGTSAVVNAVVRVAYAVKDASAKGYIAALQTESVVTLYNTVWE